MSLATDTLAALADKLRSKVARQADEIRRRDARIEALTADKRLLAFDCGRLRAENKMLREALIEARGRWQAMEDARDDLEGSEPLSKGVPLASRH